MSRRDFNKQGDVELDRGVGEEGFGSGMVKEREFLLF